MRIKGVLVFTIVEIVTLVGWLSLATSRGVSPFVAAGVLFAGLLVEHIIQGIVKRGARISVAEAAREVRERLGGIVGFTAIETVIWIGALILERALPVVSGTAVSAATLIFLAVTLIVKHTLAENVFANKPLLSRLVLGRVVEASIFEAVGGAVWLANPVIGTIVFMAATSFIEHLLLTPEMTERVGVGGR